MAALSSLARLLLGPLAALRFLHEKFAQSLRSVQDLLLGCLPIRRCALRRNSSSLRGDWRCERCCAWRNGLPWCRGFRYFGNQFLARFACLVWLLLRRFATLLEELCEAPNHTQRSGTSGRGESLSRRLLFGSGTWFLTGLLDLAARRRSP